MFFNSVPGLEGRKIPNGEGTPTLQEGSVHGRAPITDLQTRAQPLPARRWQNDSAEGRQAAVPVVPGLGPRVAGDLDKIRPGLGM